MKRILVVEDEKPINDLITMNLSIAGYDFAKAYDGKEALHMIKEEKFDLILLDVMLPEIDGFEVMNHIRPLNIPVIFITAKSSLPDRMQGFDLGAYDYVVKPFEVLELLARVKVALRSCYGEGESTKIGDVEIRIAERIALKNGKEIALAPIEYGLLETLWRSKNIALSRDKLLENVWGYEFEGDTRTVDVHIQKLRSKLGFENVIKTVYKIGYRLEEPR